MKFGNFCGGGENNSRLLNRDEVQTNNKSHSRGRNGEWRENSLGKLFIVKCHCGRSEMDKRTK